MGTVSNALLKSRTITSNWVGVLVPVVEHIVDSVADMTTSSCDSHDLARLKPCCSTVIMLYFFFVFENMFTDDVLHHLTANTWQRQRPMVFLIGIDFSVYGCNICLYQSLGSSSSVDSFKDCVKKALSAGASSVAVSFKNWNTVRAECFVRFQVR